MSMPCQRGSWGCWALALGMVMSQPGRTTTLLEAFRNAQSRDPAYLSAVATHRASQELMPQARAGLLPSLGLSALYMNNRLDKTDAGIDLPQQRYRSDNRTLTLRQGLVRPLAWAQLEQAQFQVSGALHDLQRAHNELAVRVATAYLDALYAQDQEDSARSQAHLLTLQLNSAIRGFQQGVGIVSDIDEAQARLGQAEAELAQFQSARRLALQQLSLFAGVTDPAPLHQVSGDFTFHQDQPSLTEWIERGEQSNPEIQSGQMKAQAALVEIKKSTAGHLPTLDLVAQISDSRNENIQFPTIAYWNRQWGVQLSVPLFSGGAIQSQVRQAQAQAEQEAYGLNAARIQAQLQITREYANVQDGCTKILAGVRSVRAAHHTFVSVEKNMQAGYRSRVDVFNAIDRIASTNRDLMWARYQTLLAWLKLQLLGGVPAEEAIGQTHPHCPLDPALTEHLSWDSGSSR